MLLLTTGSLLGIINIYQPVSVETQPQQPPQPQQQQQPLVPPDQAVKKAPPLVQPKPLQKQFGSLLRNDLTGIWKSQDQGTYYVRQVGDNIMWIGMSANDGRSWTNAFAGKIAGDTISGTWVDVPRGGVKGLGTLTLKVSQFPKIVMQKIGSTGSGFGGSSWVKQ
jgi:hypothetical protein